jgi:hypothetical protein
MLTSCNSNIQQNYYALFQGVLDKKIFFFEVVRRAKAKNSSPAPRRLLFIGNGEGRIGGDEGKEGLDFGESGGHHPGEQRDGGLPASR